MTLGFVNGPSYLVQFNGVFILFASDFVGYPGQIDGQHLVSSGEHSRKQKECKINLCRE